MDSKAHVNSEDQLTSLLTSVAQSQNKSVLKLLAELMEEEIEDMELSKIADERYKEKRVKHQDAFWPVSENYSKRGSRGYDAGKKIKGRKRHIIVDTVGLVIAAEVHSASIQDRDSALNLFAQAKCKVPTLRKFFADQGYIGKLQNRCLLETGCLLTIAKKIVDTGFQVIPKRWIVERTFAWLSNFRRMSKDYEHSPLTSKTNIFFNMITIMLHKLAHS
ncbi:IS5 family transposase [Trichonephila inaurata madagascariensis]|uniref:IS5 family transposase n=1 Tax=Trichonephila inaurata madagascariensis TaxID=2747483 RepID=A0A8X7CGA9_9ARAC|nr:IS5 family transposase [Trichonephila inaurata madagascariensis]